MTDLGGKVVVVTGAGRGLGVGIAQAVMEAGGTVAGVDLVPGRAAEAMARLGATGFDGDVTDREAMEELAAAVCERFRRLDGWVNNAGVITLSPALDVTRRDWDAQFDVNARAVFECCQVAAAAMIRNGIRGSIVNISSRAAKVPYPENVAYNASKMAVLSITRSLSEELAPFGINVNAVCPTTVDTEMLVEVAEYLAARSGRPAADVHADMTTAQLGRKLAPVEVGRVVAFLLSDDAVVVRGQAINADAGEAPW